MSTTDMICPTFSSITFLTYCLIVWLITPLLWVTCSIPIIHASCSGVANPLMGIPRTWDNFENDLFAHKKLVLNAAKKSRLSHSFESRCRTFWNYLSPVQSPCVWKEKQFPDSEKWLRLLLPFFEILYQGKFKPLLLIVILLSSAAAQCNNVVRWMNGHSADRNFRFLSENPFHRKAAVERQTPECNKEDQKV